MSPLCKIRDRNSSIFLLDVVQDTIAKKDTYYNSRYYTTHINQKTKQRENFIGQRRTNEAQRRKRLLKSLNTSVSSKLYPTTSRHKKPKRKLSYKNKVVTTQIIMLLDLNRACMFCSINGKNGNHNPLQNSTIPGFGGAV